jgi:rhodanese-related sulfurtransferase
MQRAMKSLRPDQIDTTTTPVIDVRMRPGSKQIRGAIHYDPKHVLEADPLVLPLPHDGPVVVYGDSEPIVAAVVDKLSRSGYSGAARLDGGMEAWDDAGLPLEETTQEQPVPGEPGAGIHRL